MVQNKQEIEDVKCLAESKANLGEFLLIKDYIKKLPTFAQVDTLTAKVHNSIADM